MIRKLTAIGLVVFIYNLFFFPFILPSFGRLDFLVFIATVLSAAWITFLPQQWGNKIFLSWRLSCLTILLAIFSLLRASPADQAFLGLSSLFVGSLSLYLLILGNTPSGGLIEYILSPLRLVKYWFTGAVAHYLFPAPNPKNQAKRPFNQTLIALFRGFIITLPIACIVTAFLASSDPVFAKLVENLFRPLAPQQLVGRSLHSALIIFVLVPLSLIQITQSFVSPAGRSYWQKFRLETIVLTSTISLILTVFLVIQFQYLFVTVPETRLHEFGVNTYSEYVRQGFVELLIVAGLVYAVLGVGYTAFRSQTRQTPALLISNYLLISELMLFIISIFRRVYLYQLHHGFTRIRIYGLVFVVYCAILAITLCLRHVSKAKRPWYGYELGAGLLLVVATTAIQPDSLIANKYPPTVNGQVDYVHISRLSIDALPGWLAAYDHAQNIASSLPDPSTITDDQTRSVIYASDSLGSLIEHYGDLIFLYGNQSEYQSLYPSTDLSSNLKRFQSPPDRQILLTNFAEKNSYNKLHSSITVEKIVSLQKALTEYVNLLPAEKKAIPYDRSYESPLL